MSNRMAFWWLVFARSGTSFHECLSHRSWLNMERFMVIQQSTKRAKIFFTYVEMKASVVWEKVRASSAYWKIRAILLACRVASRPTAHFTVSVWFMTDVNMRIPYSYVILAYRCTERIHKCAFRRCGWWRAVGRTRWFISEATYIASTHLFTGNGDCFTVA
jgi:hypothetical protein